ncbi:MAG: hypothetical protein SNF33_02110 [Candidatus Algichlamydia australiensis]|nr:hypothetical protein [Chlamydiales bacterium]
MKKKIVILIFSLPLFWGVERFAHAKTDGFALVNITSPLRSNSKWEVENPAGWEEILKQEFSYLSCGAQCYVFASADGKYVLKFFKHQHMRIPPLLEKIPLPSQLDAYRSKKIEKKRALQEATFSSMKIAYDNLKEETALIALHLNKTDDLLSPITLKDKIGILHRIDPNQFEFVLQKRGKLAYEEIEKFMAQDEKYKAEKLLRDALLLTQKRIAKGIFDKDPDFKTNFGIVEGKLVQIDIGRFSKNRVDDPEELYRITRPLAAQFPQLFPPIYEEIFP